MRNGPTEILQLGQNEILAINRGAFDGISLTPVRLLLYERSTSKYARNTLIHIALDGMSDVPGVTNRIIRLYHSGDERDNRTISWNNSISNTCKSKAEL